MEAQKSKISTEKINNSNFKVLPVEDYVIDYEGLKYKDHPLRDYGRMFCHLDRIMLKGSKKQQQLAKEMYTKYLYEFMSNDHHVVPEDYTEAKERADIYFRSLLPEKCYVEVEDVAGKKHYILNEYQCTEDEYNDAIQQWEQKFRDELQEDLAEKWCWEDDRVSLFRPNVQYYPMLKSPVTIPSWMFATDTFNEQNFHALTDIEKCALAHAIWFTMNGYRTGYIESSGHVEQWCRCSISEVHRAFQSLYWRKLVNEPLYACSSTSKPLTRNWGWVADVVFIQQVLSNYRRVIDQ